MYIAFICAVFPPEPEPSGVMAKELATELVSRGNEVTVIVPYPNRPGGRIYPGHKRQMFGSRTRPEGYQIFRCATWLVGPSRRSFDRIMENLTFGISSALSLLRAGHPDAVLLETWPLLAATCAFLVAKLRGIPIIYYVKDVYPEALEFAGFINRRGFLANMLRRWDAMICRACQRIVVISDGMKKLLCESRHIQEEKVAVIHDWLDDSRFPQPSLPNGWRTEQDIDRDKFLVLFAGTMGHVSGGEVIIEVAKLLRNHNSILILCVGEGVLKPRMCSMAQDAKLTNVIFKPFQPQESISRMHTAADATLLTLQPGYSDASVPSKLITYLAAGRPVICAAPRGSSAAGTVETAQAGLVVQPNNAEEIAAAILSLQSSAKLATTLGSNARRHFESTFTFHPAYHRFEQLFADLLRASQLPH
jgi:colanic acid biosynthesis glycosyl transferase WcaI